MPTIRAAILDAPNQDLRITEVELAPPGPHEVLVRYGASGVCHSDLHVVDGEWSAPFPIVLGHEGAGVVEAVGAGVEHVAPGDHAVLSWWYPCGTCRQCRHGEHWVCSGNHADESVLHDGTTRLSNADGPVHQYLSIGTFGERAVVPASAVVPIPAEVPFDVACLIGCGVATGVGAVVNTAGVEPGASVAVIGCGGVGLSAIQGARLAGASAIVAVDVLPEKLALALELGATAAVDASSGDAVAEVRSLTDGVDYAFTAITQPSGLVDAVRMCAYGGTATLVGVPPPGRTLDVDLERDLFHPKVAIAVTLGGDTIPQQDFPFLAQAALDGRIDLDRFVTKTIALDDVPDALDELHGATGVRTVVRL
jgi:S-(hydroxymethyl)glutathione dehydrogenase/alcohol dehydrogenase